MTQGSFFPPVPSADRSIDDVDATAEVGPAWYRPSESELPGALAWVVVIGSSPTTAVSLENWRVGSNGVVVTLAVRAAERGRRDRKASGRPWACTTAAVSWRCCCPRAVCGSGSASPTAGG